MLYSRFSLVIYFIHHINSVYMSVPISQFIPSPLPLLVSIHLFSKSVSLFLLANKIIYTIFLDSTYMRYTPFLGGEFESEFGGAYRTWKLLLLDSSCGAPDFPMDLESRKSRQQCWPPVTSSFSQFYQGASVALWRLIPLLWF